MRVVYLRSLGVGVLGCFLAVSPAAWATTWYVPSAQCPTIQSGIDQASEGDTVLVAAGTYMEYLVMEGPEDEIVLMSESGREVTAIEGGLGDRPLYCHNVGSGAMISGFTIRYGHALGAGELTEVGGGIFCHDASPRIVGNTIIDNMADRGGGVGIQGPVSEPFIQGNTIVSNQALADGGGVFSFNASPTITENQILENQAGFVEPSVGAGAGVACSGGSPMVRDNLIAENHAAEGPGGVYCSDACEGEISDNVIRDNVADGYYGGGLRCRTTGGAVVLVERNLIVGNTALLGGGILVDHGCATIVSSSLVANGYGGIHVTADIVTVKNCIVAGTPTGGGVVRVGGTLDLMCNDVWNNSPADYVGCSPGPGDFSEDPLFCGPGYGDYTLDCNSPCIDGYGCGLVGAYGQGCGPTRAQAMTWSSLKARYR